jgi:cytochrome b
MNTTSASRAEAGTQTGAEAGTQTVPSRRIIDAPTRAFHWLMALSFAGAYITAESERWRLVHVTLGYTVIGLLVFRVLWGLLGPRQVRLSVWAGKLSGVKAFVQTLKAGRVNWQAGQNLLQTLAIVGLLVLLISTTGSGYSVYQELTGEWMEDVHEVLGNAALAIVGLHLVMVVVGSLLRRQNLALTMLTGRTPGRGPDLVKKNRAPLAALLLACVLAGWVWQWQNAPSAAEPAAWPDAAAATKSRSHADSDD